VQHPGIIRCLGYSSDYSCILLDYMENGTLF